MMRNAPPKFLRYLLNLIFDPKVLDEISGDLDELYADRMSSNGKWYANLCYAKDVFLSVRNFRILRQKATYSGQRMLVANNFRITFRLILRNKIYSGLNITGLALGMAAFIFISQYVAYERSFDSFQTNYGDIYRIHYKGYDDHGIVIKNCAVSAPRVGPFLAERVPEVKTVARVFPWEGLVYSCNGKKFREDGTKIADPQFLQIFHFPMLEGNPSTALRGVNELILTESTARKYFGSASAVGQVMDIDGYKSYLVTGVVADVPANSHIHFDFLLSYATLRAWQGEEAEMSWDWYGMHTYVLLNPGADPAQTEKKFADVLRREKPSGSSLSRTENFLLEPLSMLHFSHLTKEYNNDEQGNADMIQYLMLIALFILAIGWINYINLSTARALERAKEIAIRKTIGAFRTQLILQFLTESFVMNLIAAVIALVVVTTGIHYFDLLTQSRLSLEFLEQRQFWAIFGGLIAIGFLVSGLYPAFVISSYSPAHILKGSVHGKNSNGNLRRVLVVFQFASSVALIVGTTVVYLQLRFMQHSDKGFDFSKTIVVRGPNPVDDEDRQQSWAEHNITFKNELMKLSSVQQVTSSTNVPGDEFNSWMAIKKLENPDKAYKLCFIAETDDQYFQAYHIDLMNGRYFYPGSRDTSSIILNETAVRLIGLTAENCIGQKVNFGRLIRTIVGVVKDYHHGGMKAEIKPIGFLTRPHVYSLYTIRLYSDTYAGAIVQIQKIYDTFWPKAPFDYFFLDDFYNKQYRDEERFSNIFTLFAAFAIFTAFLGLFGLSSYTILQRTKEISIRKVLGAGVSGIIYLLSKEFLLLVVLGNLIAWPVSYFIMKRWLVHFPFRIEMSPLIFMFAGFVVIGTAVIAIGYRTLVAARTNPVEGLRNE